MRNLKISTAVILTIGPFVDATDGFTAETALSPSANNVALYKAGATAAVDISTRTWTAISNGMYRVTLLTTDVDTAGPMTIHANISGARPVRHDFNVFAVTTYDTLFGGLPLPTNVIQINANPACAANLLFATLGMQPFEISAGSTTTRIATNLTQAASSHWNGRTLVLVSGTLAGQVGSISGYNGSTKELTVSALTSAPLNGDLAIIV